MYQSCIATTYVEKLISLRLLSLLIPGVVFPGSSPRPDHGLSRQIMSSATASWQHDVEQTDTPDKPLVTGLTGVQSRQTREKASNATSPGEVVRGDDHLSAYRLSGCQVCICICVSVWSRDRANNPTNCRYKKQCESLMFSFSLFSFSCCHEY